jgi:hypothetical protein
MRALWLYAFLILSCGAATVEEKKMDTKIQDLITQKVHAEQGWKTDEVRVDAEDDLRHGSCSFYTVRHKVRPLSYVLNYAVLSSDVVISLADDLAVSKILDTCGSDAGAGWWAEIITRFHQDLGSGVVLQNATDNRLAVQKITAAKKEFSAPAFGNEKGSKTVTYYLLEPESNAVFLIKAAKNADGSVTVTREDV